MKIAKLTIAILLSVALLLLAGCGGEKKQEQKPAEKPKAAQTLKVGMDAAYPPFGSQDVTSKEYVGFDVDVIKAIGAAEGFNVTIHNIPFDGLIPALQAGNIDVAINDITINEDRAKSVDFSKRYYIAGLGVVVKKDNNSIKTEKDLEGKRLGVSIGSILRIQAEQMRDRRFDRAEKQANEAPVKMLGPLMLCIFPAVFVILLGPLVLQAARSLF